MRTVKFNWRLRKYFKVRDCYQQQWQQQWEDYKPSFFEIHWIGSYFLPAGDRWWHDKNGLVIILYRWQFGIGWGYWG